MTHRISGFTLIELSIVLIIIGLISAAVLMGNDLIASARIRAQISQIEKMNTAVNTFRLKYGGIPGDLTADKAQAYAFTARSGAASHGDGNGTLEACTTAGAVVSDLYFGCETALFWSDLSKANLIQGNFTAAIDDFVITMPPTDNDQYLPKSALGGYIAVFSRALLEEAFAQPGAAHCADTFCYSLIKNMFTLNNGRITAQIGITPYQAYTMDNKIDDGKPQTGTILTGPSSFTSGYNFTLHYIADIPNTRCRNAADNSYNLTPDKAAIPECIMNFVHR